MDRQLLAKVTMLVVIGVSSGGFTGNPADQQVIPGESATFTCDTEDSTRVPEWVLEKEGETDVILSYTEGGKGFMYSSIAGGIATLMTTATKEQNGTRVYCKFLLSTSEGVQQINSSKALFSVYGEPLPPHLINFRTRYNSVRLSWPLPWSFLEAPVTGYQVQMLSNGLEVLRTADTGVDQMMYTFDGLDFQTIYIFRAAAINAVGQGEWGNLVNVTTPEPEAPGPPTAFTGVVTISGGTASIAFSWTAPEITEDHGPLTDIKFYHKIGDGDFTEAKLGVATSHELTELPLETTVEAYLVANNFVGDSADSAPFSTKLTYLLSHEYSLLVEGLNITCIFANTVENLTCSVSLASSEGTSQGESIVNKETTPHSAIVIVNGLKAIPWSYNVSVKLDNGNLLTVSGPEDLTPIDTPPPPTTTPPTTLPPTGTVLSLTNEQIGIIAGVVSGIFVVMICVLAVVFACIAMRESCTQRHRRAKRKIHNSKHGATEVKSQYKKV